MSDKPLVPVWEITDAEVICGAKIKWPDRRDPRLKDVPEKFKDVANALFFKGGKLSDHGLSLRPDTPANFMKCLRAVLCSFEPPHEVKEAVAGSLLQHYCQDGKP